MGLLELAPKSQHNLVHILQERRNPLGLYIMLKREKLIYTNCNIYCRTTSKESRSGIGEEEREYFEI